MVLDNHLQGNIIMNQPIKQVTKTVHKGVKAAGTINDIVNDTISFVVNGVAGAFNRATRVLGSEPLLEQDPTGPVEVISEGLNIIPNAARAINSNLQELLTLDPSIAKGLNKLGEKGDKICDEARGDVRATVELPWNFFRDYNVCLSTKTVRNLAGQLLSNPSKPLLNFGECALSETIFKPIDHATRDLKNATADAIATVGSRPRMSARAAIRSAANNIIGALQKGLSGAYMIYPHPDTWTCFQAKTDGVPYDTVKVKELVDGLTSMKFLKRERIEPTAFSMKDDRVTCKI